MCTRTRPYTTATRHSCIAPAYGGRRPPRHLKGSKQLVRYSNQLRVSRIFYNETRTTAVWARQLSGVPGAKRSRITPAFAVLQRVRVADMLRPTTPVPTQPASRPTSAPSSSSRTVPLTHISESNLGIPCRRLSGQALATTGLANISTKLYLRHFLKTRLVHTYSRTG